MIYPFVEEKTVVNGKSYGLSSCSYDVRIDQNLTLNPGDYALASTIEDLDIPNNVAAFVVDKSSYARLGIMAFNTLIDAGFKGNLTLELKNTAKNIVQIQQGDPICQLVFHWLDEPTDRPYTGKYQNQKRGPQPVILEPDR